MPYEPLLIRCDACNARIVLRGDQVIYPPKSTARKNSSDDREVQSGVHEGSCPKCDSPFEIWSQLTLSSTHTLDLEVNRPDIFEGDAVDRVAQLAVDRKDEAERREQARIASEERKKQRKITEQARAKAKEEERKKQREARIASQSSDDGDWDWDEDDGGRTPNDDRSDSMNPNNDAYWASRQ